VNTSIKDKMLDIIFPPICPVCGAFGAAPCKRCQKYIKTHRSECGYCRKISRKFKTHKDCKRYFPLEKLIVAVEYNQPVRKIIHSLKYRYIKSLTHFLSQKMVEAFNNSGEEIQKNSVIVPVPLHKKKFRQRGFNQAELISTAISVSLSIPVIEALKRTVYTLPQASLNKERRIKNLKNVFVLDQNISLHPLTRFVIVDDVVTTGTTITSCAYVLKHYFPFSKIYGLVFARRRKIKMT